MSTAMMLAARSITRTAARRGITLRAALSTEAQAPATFSEERMAQDKRYAPTGEVPHIRGDFDSEFSIGGNFREGRAAYLDHSATTPLDPRVLDQMAPYMVG